MTVTATCTQTLSPVGHYQHTSESSQTDINSTQGKTSKSAEVSQNPPEKKIPLSADSIRAVLEVIPEKNQLYKLLDQRRQKIHNDQNLDDLSKLFIEIINLNSELFSTETDNEKAIILYQFHSDKILEPILTNDLSLYVNSFLRKLNPEDRTEKTKEITAAELTKSMYIHFHQFGSIYPAIAIKKALNLTNLELFQFDEYRCKGIKLKEPSNLVFYDK